MKSFLKKYYVSLIFGFMCPAQFVLFNNIFVSEDTPIFVWYIIPAILIVLSSVFNYKKYISMSIGATIRHALFSLLLYLLSLILFFYLESRIENSISPIDSEDYGSAMYMFMTTILFSFSVLVAYIIPIVLKISRSLLCYIKGDLIK